MSKLEDEIRNRGGGLSSVEALLWCQEKNAIVFFVDQNTTWVEILVDDTPIRKSRKTFIEAVLAHIAHINDQSPTK